MGAFSRYEETTRALPGKISEAAATKGRMGDDKSWSASEGASIGNIRTPGCQATL